MNTQNIKILILLAASDFKKLALLDFKNISIRKLSTQSSNSIFYEVTEYSIGKLSKYC